MPLISIDLTEFGDLVAATPPRILIQNYGGTRGWQQWEFSDEKGGKLVVTAKQYPRFDSAQGGVTMYLDDVQRAHYTPSQISDMSRGFSVTIGPGKHIIKVLRDTTQGNIFINAHLDYGLPPPPAPTPTTPCTCAILFIIITSILGLLMQVF